MARLEQFRRRLGMPEGAEAVAQREALDRLAQQDRGEPGSLLQFVERCSLITYASSARLERLQQDQPAAEGRLPRVLRPGPTAPVGCPVDQGRLDDGHLLHPPRWLRHA